MKEVWRDVPGYGGKYQASDLGNVANCWWRGQPMKNGHRRVLKPYVRKRGTGTTGNALFVHLTDTDGITKEVKVSSVILLTFRGPKPHGASREHIDGSNFNNCIYNLRYSAPADLGKKTGANSRRIPVNMLDQYGEIISTYSSAREAARENFCSYQTIIDHCNGKNIKRGPFWPTGYAFSWDNDTSMRRVLRAIKESAEKAGLPYNDPHTPKYYDLEQQSSPPSLDGAVWAEI